RCFVKILDFGISKFDPRHELDRQTKEGALLGTPFYMSPEQVRGERDIDGRAAVYSLGVMIYECAAGEHPYPAETLTEVIAKLLETEPPPLRDLVPSLPAELEQLCVRCLAKDRLHRLGSARALADLLRQVPIDDDDTLPPPTSRRAAALAPPPSAA